MRLAVTGHRGYIGAVLVPILHAAGHEVVGIDSGLFDGCEPLEPLDLVEERERDIRDVTSADLDGCEAVLHLAAVSNDPMGALRPETTDEINHVATVRLAELAKRAGVSRFLFSSSCSLYGAASTDTPVDEDAPMNPVSAYGAAKMHAEAGLRLLADDDFSPIYLRNATAYGPSPRLRTDLVVNNLTASAVTAGEVRLQSDGSPWRPLVHVEDIARAFVALLDAPRDVVHDQAFNVGRNDANHRIREVAEMVAATIEGSEVTFADGAGPDLRSYRVSFDKLRDLVPAFLPQRTVPETVHQLGTRMASSGLDADDLFGRRFVRLQHLSHLLEQRRIDDRLRWLDRASDRPAKPTDRGTVAG